MIFKIIKTCGNTTQEKKYIFLWFTIITRRFFLKKIIIHLTLLIFYFNWVYMEFSVLIIDSNIKLVLNLIK
jgi:hypothetical protein